MLWFLFLAAVAILTVFAPLGFFTWFGIDKQVVLFKAGFRTKGAVLLAIYYSVAAFLAYRSFRPARRARYVAAFWGMWAVGFAGFLRVFLDPM
jgi:hypothetical protein